MVTSALMGRQIMGLNAAITPAEPHYAPRASLAGSYAASSTLIYPPKDHNRAISASAIPPSETRQCRRRHS